MSGFLQATLRATFGLVALLESVRSTPGPGEKWREALQLVLLVSVPMRLVHGRLALTFRASSCGGGGQALAWPDDPGEAASRRQALPRAAVQLASALRCLGLGVWWRRDSPSAQTTSTGGDSLRRLGCIPRPNGSQSRNGIGLCLGMRLRGQAVRDGRTHLAGPAGALETQTATRFGHWQPVGTPTRWTMPSTVGSSRDQSIEAGDVHLHARAVPRGRGESHRFRHNKTRSRRSVPDPGVDEPRCDAVFPRAREPALPNLRMRPTKLLVITSLLVWMVNRLRLAWRKSYRMLLHVAQTLTRLRMPGHT